MFVEGTEVERKGRERQREREREEGSQQVPSNVIYTVTGNREVGLSTSL